MCSQAAKTTKNGHYPNFTGSRRESPASLGGEVPLGQSSVAARSVRFPNHTNERENQPGARLTKPFSLKGALTPNEHRLLGNWVTTQGANLVGHCNALRPFAKTEFGTGPTAPSEVHIQAVNRFIDRLREKLDEQTRWVVAAAKAAQQQPTGERLQVLLTRKEIVSQQILYVEGIWDFYHDLFVQRLSGFGEQLRSIDRIAANCYEDLYTGLGTAQPTPALLPFSYADSSFSPFTYRRGVPLARLRHNKNLFPLIILPQHRLSNVWALSSVLHEVSHNLQFDLGLWEAVPARLFQRLTREGRLPLEVVRIWVRWHKEMMADMLALLLGGPGAVESLMDVVGRPPAATLGFSPTGAHPVPYLRVLISLVLLRRIGLPQLANDLQRVWQRLYPNPTGHNIPDPLLRTFSPACELAVDTMVFQPYPQLANKTLAQIIRFSSRELGMIKLAGERLASGQDVGTIPARFMISAARFALAKQPAKAQTINDNFYRVLGRR